MESQEPGEGGFGESEILAFVRSKLTHSDPTGRRRGGVKTVPSAPPTLQAPPGASNQRLESKAVVPTSRV